MTDGTLHIVEAVDLAKAAQAGWAATHAAEGLERGAVEALRYAAELAGPGATTRLVDGPAIDCLMAELERSRATLVAVGTHGVGRAAGALLGHVSTTLVHEAPCSVLVARACPDPDAFPRSIVLGLDGSEHSAVTARSALELRDRFGVPLRTLVAVGGKGADVEAARAVAPDLEVVPGRPVDELVAASSDADLVVVGSHGLHGLRSLGSVSERVAHHARCTVLVVRPARLPE